MNYSENILGTIGNTPLVRLNRVTKEVDALVLAKVETFNPGNSVKDRMAVKMIADAEASGVLKPGGTIIEGTSGNTGMGLALVAIIKGYKLICVISDKQSKEKMDILRAVGAEVVEGIFVGNSAGAAIKGLLQLKDHFKPEDVVVVLFHDSGSRYVGKMFNDEWMKEKGYLDEDFQVVEDAIKSHIDKPLITAKTEELVSHAIERMRKFKISQIPVTDTTGFVGSIDEADLIHAFVEDQDILNKPLHTVMGHPYPIVKAGSSIKAMLPLFTPENQAVLIDLGRDKYHIVTKHDLIAII